MRLECLFIETGVLIVLVPGPNRGSGFSLWGLVLQGQNPQAEACATYYSTLNFTGFINRLFPT
jgi:hypothetical protein